MEGSNPEKNNSSIKIKRERFRTDFRKQTTELLLNKKRQLFAQPSSLIKDLDLSNIQILAADLYKSIISNEEDLFLKNLKELRKTTCVKDVSHIDDIIETGIVPHIINFFGKNDKVIKETYFEALWLFTNLATGTTNNIKCLIDANIIAFLKDILEIQDTIIVLEQAVMCAANISSELEFRDIFFIGNFDVDLLKLISKMQKLYNKTLYRNIAFFLANLSRNNKNYLNRFIPFLDTLAQFLHQEDEETIIEASWTLLNISELDYEYFLKIKDFGILTKIFKNLLSPNNKIKWVSLRFTSFIASGPDIHTDFLYQNNIFSYLSGLLDNINGSIKKETLFCISNLVAEDKEEYLQTFIDSDIFHKVLKLIAVDEFVIVLECIYILCNYALSCGPNLIRKFIEKGAYQILVGLFVKYIEENKDFLIKILEALEKILQIEGRENNHLIKEFVSLGGVEALKKGTDSLSEQLSMKCHLFYKIYIIRNEDF